MLRSGIPIRLVFSVTRSIMVWEGGGVRMMWSYMQFSHILVRNTEFVTNTEVRSCASMYTTDWHQLWLSQLKSKVVKDVTQPCDPEVCLTGLMKENLDLKFWGIYQFCCRLPLHPISGHHLTFNYLCNWIIFYSVLLRYCTVSINYQ